MTRRRALVILGALTLTLLVSPVDHARKAAAQILPTTTTVPPSSSSTTRPKPSTTATTRPGTTTSSRPRSTTSSSSSSTTITTIAPPTSIVQTEEEPPPNQGQGDLSKVFPVLSVLGFVVAYGMVGTRLFRTRREDARLAERAREILSRRALRRSRRPPQP